MSIDRIPENARASDQNARALSSTDQLAAAIEKEIERIRAARPQLSSRLDRASNLLLLQLASPPRQRPMKVRIGTGGRRLRFLVCSLTSGGVIYCVSPGTFECSCPDAHRRGQGRGCKHSIAVYILLRAAGVQGQGCAACDRGWVFRGEAIVDPESGEIVEGINPVRCKHCRDGLSEEDVQRWLESQRWNQARSRPDNPHSFCLRREADDQKTFERIVEFIREYGSPYPWWGHVYRQYVCGSYAYWSMGALPAETKLINRKSLEQVRQDQLTNKGGGGIVWPWLHHDVGGELAELRRQENGQDELLGGR